MTAKPVDTYGWDTALALRVSDVNRLLLPGARGGKEFAWTYRAIVGKWSFAPWIIGEASGSQICLELRFAAADIKRGKQTLPLSGVKCAVTCEMVLKPAGKSSDGASRNVATTRKADGPKWAKVEVLDNEKALSPLERADLRGFLDAWFRTSEALDEFERQFAGIAIDTVIGESAYDRLRPRAIGFAGAVSPDGKQLFGILAKTMSESVIGCPYLLSAYGIPEGAHAGLAISAETFLAELIRPAFIRVFALDPQNPGKHFAIQERNKIRNKTSLSISLKTKDGSKYKGSIAPDQFEVALVGDALTIVIHDMTVPVDLGLIRDVATMHVRVEHRLGLRLATTMEDPSHSVLSVFERAPPVVKDFTDKKLGLQIAEISIELAGTIVAAVVAAFGHRAFGAMGANSLVARIMAALTAVLVQLIGDRAAHVPEDIMADFEAGALQKLPNFTRYVNVGLRHIRWAKDVRYRAVSAELCDCVLVGLHIEEGDEPISGATA